MLLFTRLVLLVLVRLFVNSVVYESLLARFSIHVHIELEAEGDDTKDQVIEDHFLDLEVL